jgi:hypothetical protein
VAQFNRIISSSGTITTIQGNGSTLPTEQTLNFIGSDYTFADDVANSRTNITLPALVHIAGSTMTGPLILSADPVTALGAATKQYVDSLSSGLSPRTSCVVATTAALTVTYSNGASGVGATLTNAGTQAALAIDGVSLSVNDRVLVKDQVSTFQNGIYVVTTVGSGATNWVLTRATDYDSSSPSEVVAGSYTIIINGTVNGTILYIETGPGPFTIGTTPIVFSAFNSAANINVTAPLTKMGNTIALTTPLAATFGGTGVSNSNTITLGGNISTAGALITSGANSLTFTTSGPTNVTLPTSGTLVNTAVTSLLSLVSIGTITTGVWNGTLIGPIYGGTGVNNGTSTITLGGSLTTSGAFASTFTMTGVTNVTFPTSGTLATTSQIPTLPISLANGGTSTNLTANNGGIFYSTATTGAILSGTATANQILQSGSSSAPAWSTATYPATTTINQLLYSSAANVLSGLATANSGVLITSAGGIPSIGTTLPSGVQGNITSTGTIASGAWNGGVIAGQYGGTGVANTGKTITLGGNFTTSGAFASTFTLSNTTTVTLPTSGTLLANTNNLSDVSSAATSRANLGVDVCLYQVTTQVFAVSGTYTPTTGMVYCIIECWGGGGGGGGTASATVGQYWTAGGGGAGSNSRHVATAAAIGASQVVTIGAGGNGGVAGANNGSAGGDTSVGALCIGKGAGGGGTATAQNGAAGVGGTSGTGNIITGFGQYGNFGSSAGVASSVTIVGGMGGSTQYGSGGIGGINSQIGSNATGVGAGGGGAACTSTGSTAAGGNGSAGYVIITEYIKRS